MTSEDFTAQVKGMRQVNVTYRERNGAWKQKIVSRANMKRELFWLRADGCKILGVTQV